MFGSLPRTKTTEDKVMIAYVKGTLTEVNPISVVIEAYGIGHLIYIPASLFGALPPLNSPLLLYTSFIVREQSQTLYGFLSADERSLFELLLTVSGIGPKIALSIISHLPAKTLSAAIHSSDIGTICRIPGIGKKSAERMIIEMKDKLPQATKSPKECLASDALGALLNLGYQQSAAQKAIKITLEKAEKTPDLPTLITSALKNI